MKTTAKVLILGMTLCLIGAILADLGVVVTSWVCGLLGCCVLLVGPLAVMNMEGDK